MRTTKLINSYEFMLDATQFDIERRIDNQLAKVGINTSYNYKIEIENNHDHRAEYKISFMVSVPKPPKPQE